MDPGRVDADVKTAPAPEAPARPAPGAVPSAEPLHGPVDTAEDSLDGLQTAFSKKKCFSIALEHTLVVLEMH